MVTFTLTTFTSLDPSFVPSIGNVPLQFFLNQLECEMERMNTVPTGKPMCNCDSQSSFTGLRNKVEMPMSLRALHRLIKWNPSNTLLPKLVPFFAALPAFLFPCPPSWPGIHLIVTWHLRFPYGCYDCGYFFYYVRSAVFCFLNDWRWIMSTRKSNRMLTLL